MSATCCRHPQCSQERTPPKGSRERAVRRIAFYTADPCSVRAVRVCTAFGLPVSRVVSGSGPPWRRWSPSRVASVAADRPVAGRGAALLLPHASPLRLGAAAVLREMGLFIGLASTSAEVVTQAAPCLFAEDAQITKRNMSQSALRCCSDRLIQVTCLCHFEACNSRSTSTHKQHIPTAMHPSFVVSFEAGREGFLYLFLVFLSLFPSLRVCSPSARFCVASLYGSLSPLVLFISCSFCSCALPRHTPTWFSSHVFSLFLLRIGRVTIQQRHLVQWRQ